jgi:heme/copper-type cytochrome/quinol oxidase subunit 1
MPPRIAVLVARVYIAVIALVVLAGLVGGAAMQLELWAPGPAWSADRYGRMLGVHSLLAIAVGAPALAGCFGYLAVADLVGARRIVAPAIAWVGLGLWVIGLVATTIQVVRQVDTGWTLYTPYSLETPSSIVPRVLGPVALASAGLVFAGHLGATILLAVRSATPARLALATAFVLAVVWACIAAIADTLAIVPDGAPGRAAMLIAALLLATSTLVRRGPHTPLALLIVGIVPALAVYGATRLLSLSLSTELHVHDTHFVVGGEHLLGATIAFAGLAALHAWCVPLLQRVPNGIVTWVGASVCSGGVLLHAWASFRVGTRGMPRRYWDYDPSFTAGHQLAAVAAAISIAGLVILGIAWIAGRRAPQVDTR